MSSPNILLLMGDDVLQAGNNGLSIITKRHIHSPWGPICIGSVHPRLPPGASDCAHTPPRRAVLTFLYSTHDRPIPPRQSIRGGVHLSDPKWVVQQYYMKGVIQR